MNQFDTDPCNDVPCSEELMAALNWPMREPRQEQATLQLFFDPESTAALTECYNG